jgi:hypothetical protein
MRTFLVALLALSLAPSLADAGGNKGNTIKVRNRGGDILAVIVDNDGFFDTGTTGTNGGLDVASFVRAGGRLVGPGGTIVLTTRFNSTNEGTHDVTAAYVVDIANGFALGASDTITVTVPRNGSIQVTATENADGSVTLSSP